jgi:glucose-6-phosphate isomerase
MRSRPYGYPILPLQDQLSSFENHIERRLSSLRNKFSDQTAFQTLLVSGDPIIYEVYESCRPEAAGELASGLSIVHPGRVGQEYFMTRGHYHKIRDTAEVYYCIQGKGVLLMENESGDTAVEELYPGRVVYVTPRWAHRSINTGGQDLVTFFVYPANAGHDYATIDAKGFRKRLLDHDGVPTIVDNHQCSERSG